MRDVWFSFGIILLATVSFGLCAGTIGLFAAGKETVHIKDHGTVPAHRCVVESGYRCGVYFVPHFGFVEVGRNGPRYTWEIVGFKKTGLIDRRQVPVPPTVLTEAQTNAAYESRAAWQRELAFENATLWAGGGATVGMVLACLYLILFYFRLPALLLHGAKQGLRRAQTASQNIGEASQSLRETATLRAEVHKTELLARKAAAEAKLRREHPDATQHEIKLR